MDSYCTTSAVIGWIPLFQQKCYRDIVLGSLCFLVEDGRIDLHGYVLLPNHIHLIFSLKEDYTLSAFLRDFHKYTSQRILQIMRSDPNGVSDVFRSERSDRKYQIWQEKRCIKEIHSRSLLQKKINSLHQIPCQKPWNLCKNAEDYPYSSAVDYSTNERGIVPICKRDQCRG